MASKERQEFADKRRMLLAKTTSKQFICARCGKCSKSVHLHHIKELIDGGSNDNKNLIPLCENCHIEWDDGADVGMEFGEFLVSLSSMTWQIAAMTGLFRSPYPVGEAFANIYKIQFTGNAIKFDVGKNRGDKFFSYWDELKQQNEMFQAYPYSDHDKMIKLYGKMYETLSSDAFAKHTKKIAEDFTASKKAI